MIKSCKRKSVLKNLISHQFSLPVFCMFSSFKCSLHWFWKPNMLSAFCSIGVLKTIGLSLIASIAFFTSFSETSFPIITILSLKSGLSCSSRIRDKKSKISKRERDVRAAQRYLDFSKKSQAARAARRLGRVKRKGRLRDDKHSPLGYWVGACRPRSMSALLQDQIECTNHTPI